MRQLGSRETCINTYRNNQTPVGGNIHRGIHRKGEIPLAERRMFAKTIVLSDAFLDMPLSARCLYFTLGMLADDDGFVNSPKSIMRQAGASVDDLNLLIAKRFILTFDSGIIVIKHWRIHNYIQKDRYKETKYIEEKSSIVVDEKGAYTECIQDVYKMDTQVRLELGQDSLELGQGSGSVVPADNGEDTLKKIGKCGVVYLSDRQVGCLLDKMGIEAFDLYLDKLEQFIIDKGASVKNHYKTILKWYEEDSEV